MNSKIKLKRQFCRKVPITNAEQRDAMWDLLNSEGYVDGALAEEAEPSLQVLLKDADLMIKGVEIGSRFSTPPTSTDEPEEPAAQEEREEIRPVLSDLERERAAAFEEHVAHIAANDFRVRRYRERVMGAELLTPDQAWGLIHSPAAQVFSPRQFSNWDIPLVDHTAELKDTKQYRADGRIGYDFTVRVEPPGIERTIPQLLRELPFVDNSGYAESIMVGEKSVLGELAKLADKLSTDYPWTPNAAIVHFVLTGAIPAVPPVRMHYSRKGKLDVELSPGGFRHATITLEVAPWISAKTVEAAYRDAKRQVSGNRKFRRLEEKSLKMVRFIAGYEERPKGRRLLEAWNATEWVAKNPAWYYDPDKREESSRFWRDYHRARRALVYLKRPRPDDN